MRNSGGTVRERRRGGPGIRPGIVAGSQTALKHSDDRPDQDLTRPGLCNNFFFPKRRQLRQLSDRSRLDGNISVSPSTRYVPSDIIGRNPILLDPRNHPATMPNLEKYAKILNKQTCRDES